MALVSRLVLPLLAGLGFLAVACAATPPPASPLGAHAHEKTEVLVTDYDDRVVGAEQASEAASQYGLVDTPAATVAYVDAVGQRLARQAPGGFQYHFQIVNEDVPNAFALPGGYVFVTRGLLLLVNSETELANVLGHEMTHVAARHEAAQQAVAAAPPLALPKLVELAGAGVDLAGGQLGESRRAWLARYGRDQESDADRGGQQMAAAAGWSPQGMSEFLRDLENAERLQEGAPHLPSFLDSHPSTPDRITAASLNAASIPFESSPGITTDRAAFLARLDGLVVGDDPSEGVFQGAVFLQPDLDFAVTFPEGWQTQNTHSAVAALSPSRDVEVMLESQGAGTDPKAAADEFFAKSPAEAHLERKGGGPLTISGAPAWHEQAQSQTPQGILDMEITWLVYDGSLYRVTGVAPGAAMAAERAAALGVARSLRPLTDPERQSIRVRRLRSAAATAEETLSGFSTRTGNTWKLPRLAVVNDLFVESELQGGQLLKVAIEEAYVPLARPSPAPASP